MIAKEIIITSQRRFENVKEAMEFAEKGGNTEIRVITEKGDVVMNNPADLKKFLPVEDQPKEETAEVSGDGEENKTEGEASTTEEKKTE